MVCGSQSLVEHRPAEVQSLDEVSFNYSFAPRNNRTFRVVRCRDCSHLFCSPLPPGLLERYEDVVDEEYLKHGESRSLAADAVLDAIRRHTGGGRLLDVGCATGDFLAQARAHGFAGEGLELSGWSCAIARGRGLTVHQQTLAAFAGGAVPPFDVVTLIGVIEHFAAPAAEVRHLNRLVAPGGILVLWTGDASSWLARLLGPRWWYWQGQHIQYFTHASLSRLLREAGFATLPTERYPFAATAATLRNSLRRYPLHGVLSAALAPLFRLRRVVYLRLPGEMLVFARRLPG